MGEASHSAARMTATLARRGTLGSVRSRRTVVTQSGMKRASTIMTAQPSTISPTATPSPTSQSRIGAVPGWPQRLVDGPVDAVGVGVQELLAALETLLGVAGLRQGERVAGFEVALSTVPFPIYQTNPNQDPVIAACYMGDYNQIASNGSRRFVSWGDNRNVVTTAAGVTENQADVFLQGY
jgi:hypothetical protein